MTSFQAARLIKCSTPPEGQPSMVAGVDLGWSGLDVVYLLYCAAAATHYPVDWVPGGEVGGQPSVEAGQLGQRGGALRICRQRTR